jgi:RimJ/RimL family protein N-acetyltransferase
LPKAFLVQSRMPTVSLFTGRPPLQLPVVSPPQELRGRWGPERRREWNPTLRFAGRLRPHPRVFRRGSNNPPSATLGDANTVPQATRWFLSQNRTARGPGILCWTRRLRRDQSVGSLGSQTTNPEAFRAVLLAYWLDCAKYRLHRLLMAESENPSPSSCIESVVQAGRSSA